MRVQVNDVVAVLACAALASAARVARADEVGFGQHEWVPSFAVTSGVTLQNQSGSQESFLFDGESSEPQPTPLRPAKRGDDRVVSPFVGGAIELMTPPVLPRFRLFASAELLPMFAPERRLTDEGQATVIAGPEPNTVPATQENSTRFTIPGEQPRGTPFAQTDAKGQGMVAAAQVGQWAFGAKAGFSVSFQWRNRQMRIKPAVGWYHYKLEVKGFLVHAECNPDFRCTNTYQTNGTLTGVGFLRRPTYLKSRDSGVFEGFGPGIDLEMDTGRYGPVATSLFAGVGGYYIPGDRDIDFKAARRYDDELGQDRRVAHWRTRVAPWVYRAGVGVRFQWLGESE